MPSSRRTAARRELERAGQLIEWVGLHVNRVDETYKEAHPEISAPCVLALNLAQELQTLISRIRDMI